MRRGTAPVPTPSESCAPGKKSDGKPPHSNLRAFLPGSEVMFLLRRELVQPVTHRIELEARDFLVQVFGYDIHLRLEVFVIGAQIFGGKRLVGEAHVHYVSGMPFGGGKIDAAPFRDPANLSAVLQFGLIRPWAVSALS